MPQINWDEDDSGGGYVLPPAGKYLFAVEKAELHAGANGPYFSVMLRGVDRGKIVVWDNMSFAPKAIAITKAKLSVLGFRGQPNVEADDLIGRSAWVWVKHGEYNNVPKLEVNIAVKDTHAGYEADNRQAPAGSAQKSLAEMENDIPF